MTWKNYPREIKCPECDGYGTTTCSCCDGESSCATCGEDGIVGVNMDAIRALESSWSSPRGSWELVENDVWVGRTNGVDTLRYLDFRTDGAAKPKDEVVA